MPFYLMIAGAVLIVIGATPKMIQRYRRRNFPARFFAKEAHERHELNFRGSAMWHEQERKAEKGVG